MRGVSKEGLCALVLGLCAGWSQLHAQQGGTITGTVIDQSSKPIPGASVEVRNEATAASRTVTADNDGKFSEPDLAGRQLHDHRLRSGIRHRAALRRSGERGRDPRCPDCDGG